MSTTLTKRAFTGAMAMVLAFGMCVPATAAHADSELATAGASAVVATTASAADDTFTFSNSAITQTGSTNKVEGTALTINTPGTYLITGTCSEGSVTVKKGTTGVTLILKDLSLASSTGAPLAINKSNGDVVVQVEGTVTLTDKENAADESSTDEAVADAFEGAALKVKSGSNLTITGKGTLTADGSECKNAIKGGAESSVKVGTSASDTVTVVAKAAKNGIASDGSVTVNGGTVTVIAGNDGIKSEPDEDDTASAGTVTVNGGTLGITSAGDGIQATNDLVVNGGSLTIVANGGSTTEHKSDEDSCKGLKSDKLVQVNGGTFNLDTADDCIHSDGDVELFGGTFTLKTHDDSNKPDNMSSSDTTVYVKGGDAVHADYVTTIGKAGSTTPVITAEKCYEGIEGATVNIAGGTVKVTAQDDGINAANSDLSGYTYEVAISGGDVLVNAAGDGIDSNGNITLSGGKVEVYSSGGSDEAIDCDGSWTVTDTELLAIGGTGADWKTPASGLYVNFGATGGMGMGGMGAGMGAGGFGGQQGGFGGDQQGSFGGANGQNDFGGMSGQGGNGFNNGGGQPGSIRSMSVDDQAGDQVSESNVESQALTMPGGGFGGNMGGTSIVSSGQTVSVTDDSGTELYTTTAVGSGTTAFFAHPSLVSGSAYTLTVNGTTTYEGTAAEGSTTSTQPDFNGGTFPGGNGGSFPGGNGEQMQPGQPGEGQPGDLPNGEQDTVPADQTGDQTSNQTETQPGTDSTTNNDTANNNATSNESNANGTKDSNKTDNTANDATKTAKAKNTIKVTVAKKTVSAKALAKKAKTIKALKVANAEGTVKYTRVKGSKFLKVNARTGKVVVAKGTAPGTYRIKVKVRASGDDYFKPKSVTKLVKVTVK